MSKVPFNRKGGFRDFGHGSLCKVRETLRFQCSWLCKKCQTCLIPQKYFQIWAKKFSKNALLLSNREVKRLELDLTKFLVKFRPEPISLLPKMRKGPLQLLFCCNGHRWGRGSVCSFTDQFYSWIDFRKDLVPNSRNFSHLSRFSSFLPFGSGVTYNVLWLKLQIRSRIKCIS